MQESVLMCVMQRLAKDPRCTVHRVLLPVREPRLGWIHIAAPSSSACPDRGELFGEMVRSRSILLVRKLRHLSHLGSLISFNIQAHFRENKNTLIPRFNIFFSLAILYVFFMKNRGTRETRHINCTNAMTSQRSEFFMNRLAFYISVTHVASDIREDIFPSSR